MPCPANATTPACRWCFSRCFLSPTSATFPQLDFVEFAIGNWERKCGHLKGLNDLRTTCRNCGATVETDPFHLGDVLLQQARHLQREHARFAAAAIQSGCS